MVFLTRLPIGCRRAGCVHGSMLLRSWRGVRKEIPIRQPWSAKLLVRLRRRKRALPLRRRTAGRKALPFSSHLPNSSGGDCHDLYAHHFFAARPASGRGGSVHLCLRASLGFGAVARSASYSPHSARRVGWAF